MTGKTTVDCLGMGIIPLDLLYTVDRLPRPGGKVNAVDLCVQGGGPVPNAMVGLKRLGLRTALVAVVGKDWAGNINIDQLRRENVDTSFLIVKKAPSATAAGFIERGSGRRTIAFHRRIGLRPTDLRTSRYPQPRLIHLDGRDMAAALKLARWGRRVGALISFDIGSIRNDVSPIFPLVDHLVVADDYALPFTGARTVRQAIRKLTRLCSGCIVVTQGLRGITGMEADRFFRQQAFKVETVDTTGAGDAFHVGYLYGLLQGQPMSRRLRLGAAVAALKCTRPGGRAGMPTRHQLMRFLKNNPAAYA
ncbi:MAG: PfkB family carbohydrate kinase [bacterium]